MKISQTTITILKNFATLSQHLVVLPGNEIMIVTPKKTQFAIAVIEDNFPVEFALHDLSGFLKIVALFDDPDFEFGESSVVISDATGSSQEYFYSDKEDLIFTEVAPPIPMGDIDFVLPDVALKKILKAAGANGVEDIAFNCVGGEVKLKSLDKENPKRVFSVDLAKDVDTDFNVYIKHSKKGNKLNFLPLDYTVNITAGAIRFIAKVEDVEITYIMAYETDSEIS